MSFIRIVAVWVILVLFLLAGSAVGVYDSGIIIHHGTSPSEVLYGWDAVRYLCPRLAAGFVAVTLVSLLCFSILTSGRRR